ncbi:hypothetical protein QYM36_007915 [Artemia franciscana]|uniref:Uncharacterized protein n=1 Tax=Artemia franciscana TaxID=6661 RepID=A0AA88ITM0_ARTSF|nr:hypothetical protein QYM36_007915 [Artemia franciscana]
MASKAVTPEVVRSLPKAGPRLEKPRGYKKLCSKILTDTPEKEHLEAEHQIKEAKKSKKKSRAEETATRAFRLEILMMLVRLFLGMEGIEEGNFVLVKVVGKRITSYVVANVLVKDKI